jgi:hypothetical protein
LALATNHDRREVVPVVWSTDALALQRRARTTPMTNPCTSAMTFEPPLGADVEPLLDLPRDLDGV